MKEQQSIRNNKAVGAALSACTPPPSLQPVPERSHQTIRIALPAAPRPQLSAANRMLRKAMRAAELAVWRATGGDFLRSPLPN